MTLPTKPVELEIEQGLAAYIEENTTGLHLEAISKQSENTFEAVAGKHPKGAVFVSHLSGNYSSANENSNVHYVGEKYLVTIIVKSRSNRELIYNLFAQIRAIVYNYDYQGRNFELNAHKVVATPDEKGYTFAELLVIMRDMTFPAMFVAPAEEN